MKKNLTLFSVILFLSLVQLYSQVPQAFKYQAIARNSQGDAIVNQQVSILVEILQQSAVVFSETHNAITNAFGLINLEIGNGTLISGSFSGIDWGNGEYFISISIDPDGGEDYVAVGSAQLLSVPFALYSGKAGDSHWVKDANSDISYSHGKVQIGDPTFLENGPKLTIEGGILPKMPSGITDTDLDNFNLNNSSIGINLPQHGLYETFGGDLHMRGFWGVSIDRNGGNKGYDHFSYENGLNPDGGSFAIRYRTSPTAFRTDFLINGKGQIALGCDSTNPSSVVTIYKENTTTYSGTFGLKSIISTNLPNLVSVVRSDVGYNGYWPSQCQANGFYGEVHLSRDNATSYNSYNAGGFFQLFLENYTPAGSLQHNLGGVISILHGDINTYPSNRVIAAVIGKDSIKSLNTFAGYFTGKMYVSDKIGVGTANPQYKLHIEGNEEDAGREFIYLKNNSTTWKSAVGIKLSSGTSENFGGLSYSGSSYSYMPDFADVTHLYSYGTGGMRISSWNGPIKFGVDGMAPDDYIIPRMTIALDGNVGIGTESPQRTLHIKDVMRLEPTATAPSNPSEGDMYMNATTHKLMVYDGTTWQACW